MSKRNALYPSDLSASPILGVVGQSNPVEIPTELLRLAMNHHATRDARTSYFDASIFGEAAWDILLALYIAQGRGYSMKVSDACYEARVPPTTALRWLDHLVQTGMVERRENAMDSRSVLVRITPAAAIQMNQYLRRTAAILSRS